MHPLPFGLRFCLGFGAGRVSAPQKGQKEKLSIKTCLHFLQIKKSPPGMLAPALRIRFMV